MRRILLGLTGSVATVLYEKLIVELQQYGIVDVILTEKATHFVNKEFILNRLEKDGGNLYCEQDEWEHPDRLRWQKNDPVLHIQLRDRSSALVIAPCSLNTLAKISNGICDNLLTSVARAWDFNRPVIVAPAGNTHMWEHPITAEHISKLRGWGYKIIDPQVKMLACNTFGMGAMAEISNIGKTVADTLRWKFPMTPNGGGIPIGNHPGAFNAKRKNSIHTGVDLYVPEGMRVYPVENGTVVAVEPFTGPKDNSPWWLDTSCVLVEGASGVVCYGEIDPYVKVGDRVRQKDTIIGTVLRVIPPDRPQHPELPGWRPSMLHIELYPHGYYKPSDGYGKSADYLQDPTPFLIDSDGAPTTRFKKCST